MRITTELARLYASGTGAHCSRRTAQDIAADLVDARSEIERLTRERDEARRFGEDAAARYNASLREVTCVWCGHAFESTIQSQAEHLYEHAKVCEKHPIASLCAALAAKDEALRHLWERHGAEHLGGCAKCPAAALAETGEGK